MRKKKKKNVTHGWTITTTTIHNVGETKETADEGIEDKIFYIYFGIEFGIVFHMETGSDVARRGEQMYFEHFRLNQNGAGG